MMSLRVVGVVLLFGATSAAALMLRLRTARIFARRLVTATASAAYIPPPWAPAHLATPQRKLDLANLPTPLHELPLLELVFARALVGDGGVAQAQRPIHSECLGRRASTQRHIDLEGFIR